MKAWKQRNLKNESAANAVASYKDSGPRAVPSSRRTCVCLKHQHSASKIPPALSASVRPAVSVNPIWGDDEPLFLAEAAAHAGMALGTFRQKVYAREIESVLVGRHRKVQPSAVRAYLNKHKLPAL